MLRKNDLDKLLTLTRKWYKEKDQDQAKAYCDQALSLSREIANGTSLATYDGPLGNQLFRYACHIAEKRWPNEQLYIMVERAGETVDHWEYQGHSI
jgi:hypothetical protein